MTYSPLAESPGLQRYGQWTNSFSRIFSLLDGLLFYRPLRSLLIILIWNRTRQELNPFYTWLLSVFWTATVIGTNWLINSSLRLFQSGEIPFILSQIVDRTVLRLAFPFFSVCRFKFLRFSAWWKSGKSISEVSKKSFWQIDRQVGKSAAKSACDLSNKRFHTLIPSTIPLQRSFCSSIGHISQYSIQGTNCLSKIIFVLDHSF